MKEPHLLWPVISAFKFISEDQWNLQLLLVVWRLNSKDMYLSRWCFCKQSFMNSLNTFVITRLRKHFYLYNCHSKSRRIYKMSKLQKYQLVFWQKYLALKLNCRISWNDIKTFRNFIFFSINFIRFLGKVAQWIMDERNL